MKPIGMCPPEKRVDDLIKEFEEVIMVLKKFKIPYTQEDILFMRNLGRYLQGACLFVRESMQTVHESTNLNS